MSSTGRPGAPGRKRPPHVLMAGVAGFAEATLLFLVALVSFTFSAQVPLLALFGVFYLALTAACLWGAVSALRGRAGRSLVAASAVTGVVALGSIVVGVLQGQSVSFLPALLLLLAVGAVALLLQAPSREWFAERHDH
ncbi:hypothetical protein ACU610_14420 [Geodermatophilus sp. URMC 61]|uniref:hypothetical protein n=1 Tax=Geodermatophilus sp. URMC 61 TaxID=3423411 RepID=UPI00406CB72D